MIEDRLADFKYDSGTAERDEHADVVLGDFAAFLAEIEVEFFQFIADLLGLLAGEHDEEREGVGVETQPEFLGAAGDEPGDLVLPIVAAGVDAVVDLDVGRLFNVFPERPALVHALGGEEEFHAVRDPAFEGGAEAFDASFGALGAAGDVVGQEIRVAQPDDLVAAEHRDGEKRLDGGGANFVGRLGVVGDAVDGFVGEAVVEATGEFVVKKECLFADQTFVTADNREEVSGFLGSYLRFRGHGCGTIGMRLEVQARGESVPAVSVGIEL